jgi:general secretion pathway protein I
MTNRRHGFTVIEVLIAMAIFFGAVVVLAGAYLNVLNSYAKIENDGDYKNDVKFARAMLMAEPDLETVEKGADFETTDGHRVSWKATIEGTNVADLFAVAFECEINAAELKEPLHIADKFRLLRPTWSKPEDRDKLRADARTRIQQLQGGNGGSDSGSGGATNGGSTGGGTTNRSVPSQSSSRRTFVPVTPSRPGGAKP